MRTLAAIAVLTLAGTTAFAAVTSGFRVVTSESARRLEAVENPVALPDVVLTEASGGPRPLQAELAGDGRVALVGFIYTRCESICTALGGEFQQLQRRITDQGLQDRVRLLSISFDPAHDRPAVLAEYAGRLRADPSVWRFATVEDEDQLETLLQASGIVVVPDGRGDFVHNAAIHVVTPAGRLVRIRDLGQFELALRDAVAVAP